MKIAYISGAYVPSRGANSMHVMRMCQAMARQGHEVTLHVRPGDVRCDDDYAFYGVEPCFSLLKTRRPQVRAWGALVNAWRTRQAVTVGSRPDLIYAREFWALLLLTRAGIPFVFESHWRPKSPLHKAVEATIMRSSSFRRVVLISNELRKIYAREYPWLSADKMVVAHDGADPEPLRPGSSPQLGRDGALQVGYVGSFFPGYGIDHLESLAREMEEVDFHVIGGNPSEVADRRRKSKTKPNLRFHGFVVPAELPRFYTEINVALAPYQASTPHIQWISPMKVFEYMAHGKAIICSDFPVIREIIEDGENGLLVPSDDVCAWVRAIRGLGERARRERLGQGARVRLEGEFTWGIRARRVLDGLR